MIRISAKTTQISYFNLQDMGSYFGEDDEFDYVSKAPFFSIQVRYPYMAESESDYTTETVQIDSTTVNNVYG